MMYRERVRESTHHSSAGNGEKRKTGSEIKKDKKKGGWGERNTTSVKE